MLYVHSNIFVFVDQLNTSTNKKNTRKSPFELVFGIPPSSTTHSDLNNVEFFSSDEDDLPHNTDTVQRK